MDLFSIVCTTCKSRLRVRDPAAIGQILACPRCGGMVMVKPPPHWSGETARSDLSTATGLVSAGPPPDQTVSSSAFDAIEELLADAPPRSAPAPARSATSPPSSPLPAAESASPCATEAPASAACGSPADSPAARPQAGGAPPTGAAAGAVPARSRFVGGPPRTGADGGRKASSSAATPPSSTPPTSTPRPPSSVHPATARPAPAADSAAAAPRAAAANPSDPALPPPPPQEAAAGVAPVPQRSVRRLIPTTLRFWLALGGSVAVGVMLAVVAVAGAIHLLYGPPRGAASHSIAARGATGQTKTRSAAGTPKAATQAAGSPSEPKTGSEMMPAEATADAHLAAQLGEAASATAPAGSPPVVASPAASAGAAARSAQSGQAADTRAAQPADAVAGLAPAPLVPRPAESGGIEALAKFDRFLGGDDAGGVGRADASAEASFASSAMPVAPAAPPEGSGQAPPREAVAPAPEGRPVLPRPPPLAVDVSKRLADPLMLVQTSGTPLVDFLQLFSDLSTIPITLVPDALPLVRLTPLSPVSVEASGTTVGGALTAALRPLSLEAVTAGDHLLVRVIEPEKLRTIDYPTKDLADDEAGRVALAQLLQAVVEPSSWGDDEGQGSIAIPANKEVLSIRQRQAVHAALFIGCEKLRIARGKPPASTRYDAALFALESRRRRAAEKLGQKVTANFRQPARLVAILKRLGDLTGTTVLVDWHDIASLQWNPQAEASVVFDNQPLADALNALLEPMDLTWRIVDGQTIQVVSPQRLVTQGELEVYPVGPLTEHDLQGQALLAHLQTALGEETFAEAGGIGVLRYDPAGRCLLAWLPQPKQRQLEEALERYRAAHGAPAADRRQPTD